MGLWEILKGEEPGLIRSLKNYENKGQFGEYCIDFALTNHNLNGDFAVLRNVYVPNGTRTTEVDLLMVHEKGIFVFESKNYSGWIFGSAEQLQWTQALKGGQKNRFYNPIRQNQSHIKALAQYLDMPVDAFTSYIVFSERCELKKVPEDTSSVVILRRPDMLRHLRKTLNVSDVRYTHAEISGIAAKLEALTQITEEEKQQHIEDINTKCPFCGSALVLWQGQYGKFWGCSSYPRCRFIRPCPAGRLQ